MSFARQSAGRCSLAMEACASVEIDHAGTHQCARSSHSPCSAVFVFISLTRRYKKKQLLTKTQACTSRPLRLWNCLRDVVCCWVLRLLNVAQLKILRVIPKRQFLDRVQSNTEKAEDSYGGCFALSEYVTFDAGVIRVCSPTFIRLGSAVRVPLGDHHGWDGTAGFAHRAAMGRRRKQRNGGRHTDRHPAEWVTSSGLVACSQRSASALLSLW